MHFPLILVKSKAPQSNSSPPKDENMKRTDVAEQTFFTEIDDVKNGANSEAYGKLPEHLNMTPLIAELKNTSKSQSKSPGTFIGEFLNKIKCGDALDVMRSMPSESVDLVVTSPPYNLKNSTGNGMKDGRGGKWSTARLLNGYATHNDSMPHDVYAQWQRDCLREMFRLIKNDGAIFYNHKWRVQAGLLQDRQDIVTGFPIRQIIIWKRKGGINFNAGYFLPTYEVIYMIAKPEFKLAPKANRYGDVWEFTQEMNNPHPAPYPVDLIKRVISSTNAQVILDPFMGSGTTAVAARKLKRKYIGIELSAEYCAMAQERLKRDSASTD